MKETLIWKNKKQIREKLKKFLDDNKISKFSIFEDTNKNGKIIFNIIYKK